MATLNAEKLHDLVLKKDPFGLIVLKQLTRDAKRGNRDARRILKELDKLSE